MNKGFDTVACSQTAVKAPENLSESWFFSTGVSQEDLSRIPENAIRFTLPRSGGIDLDTVAGKIGQCGDACIVYNEFMLEKEMLLGFGTGADWWWEAYLNGRKIYEPPRGDNGSEPSTESHRFTAMGKKGRNLLAIRIRRGEGSWDFFMREEAWGSIVPDAPVLIRVDASRTIGAIKPMNAVNNGPIPDARGLGNMESWKAAAIPYARNHDASFCSAYGGEHTVDIQAVFPDFSKDPDDPASYDFTVTDRYLQTILEGGTKVFYRLGSKIEHGIKKYGTQVPPDFQKWAVICEHIIRHYNEGWADGFRMNIEYWEIWNEPDLRIGDGSPTWQGTQEQFFELYRTTALHLKKCFPNLKIGGPATCYVSPWARQFLKTMGQEKIPLDFFSWHCYVSDPIRVKGSIRTARRLLDEAGYTKTESILNEWNYSRIGGSRTDNVRAVIGLKGAAYAAAVMCMAQDEPLDMLMYYDARPSVYNGLFDFYTRDPLKTYYVFLAWAKLAAIGRQIPIETHEKNGVFAVAAERDGKLGVLISRYFDTEEPGEMPVTLELKGGSLRGARLFVTDQEHDMKEIPCQMTEDGRLLFTIKGNAVLYLENEIFNRSASKN